MNVRAICFDFDGILVDTEWAIYQAWLRTFRRYGQDLPLALYTRCIGSDFDTWSPKTHLESLISETIDWQLLDEERQVEIRNELESEGAFPGVKDLLNELRMRSMPMIVVSSSSHSWVDAWLDKLALRKYFTEVVCRGDAQRIKPAPDLYLLGAEKLGLDVNSCLVIEDSHNGLLAANAAGMRTWIVPNRVTRGSDFSLAERICEDFQEVKKQLFDIREP